MKLFEVTADAPILGIIQCFKSATASVTKDFRIEAEHYKPNDVLIKFMSNDPETFSWPTKGCMGTCYWKIMDGGTLHIYDSYLPDQLTGKGIVTNALRNIRQLNGINGTAVVHVAVNSGWPKILANAGFKQESPKIDWPLT